MYQYLLYITAPTGQICTNIVQFKSQTDFEAAKEAMQQTDTDFQWEFIPLFDESRGGF